MTNRGGSVRERLHRRGAAYLAVGALVVAFAACGGGDDSQPRVLEAGQVDIKLPPGFKVVGTKVVVPRENTGDSSTPTTGAGGASPNAPGGATTPTTAKGGVPLDNDSNPTADLLASFGKFRDCLQDEGTKFIGAPDPNNPESPTNDPTYIKSLSTCAARSNIVQALQAAQAEQDTLTPAQIKERNKGYLKWRDCMIKRGWKIPKPTPDSKGRLFAFSASGGSGPQLEPPPGKDLFSSDDITECSERAARAVGAN